MEEFVYNLKLSKGLKPSSFKEIHYSVITNIIKALIFILPSLYLLNKIINGDDISSNFDEYQKKIIEEKKNTQYLKIIQGVLFILIAIRLLFFYKPTNSELSSAILIKYLFKKNIISAEIYELLKQFKPHNIESYV